MATFREIVYMVLDLLKERSDDAYYTEEHIIFLASKIRAVLIERKYRVSRNSSYLPMSDENRQTICLDLEPATGLSGGCTGGWLQSVQKLPDIILGTQMNVYPVSQMLNANVTYVATERMPYVGHNKWLKGIIYCSRASDGKIYLHSVNPQFIYLEKIKADGVFSEPEKAAELSCNEDGNSLSCEVLDNRFPLEASLIPSLIEMVVQELMGSRYAPEDKENNARDDFGEASVTSARQARPVENSTYRQREEREE